MSREGTLRVLLDTTFILPTLGIDVGEDVLTGLKALEGMDAEIYFSRFSILECLWIVMSLIRKDGAELDRVHRGLKSVMRGGRYMMVEENDEVFREALNMYALGHRDMIDNILYSTSLAFDLKLLTVDKTLREFVREKGLTDTTVLPTELTERKGPHRPR